MTFGQGLFYVEANETSASGCERSKGASAFIFHEKNMDNRKLRRTFLISLPKLSLPNLRIHTEIQFSINHFVMIILCSSISQTIDYGPFVSAFWNLCLKSFKMIQYDTITRFPWLPYRGWNKPKVCKKMVVWISFHGPENIDSFHPFEHNFSSLQKSLF